MKKNICLVFLFGFSLFGILAGATYFFLQARESKTEEVALNAEKIEDVNQKTKGIMMLIEYKDTEGLVNFVNDLDSRGIHSLLSASPDFVVENCQVIKELLNHRMELVSQNPEGSFWDLPYQEQYEAIKNAKEKIEACTGRPLRVISSRYFASDENTVKAAEKLGIPYVLARGTTGTEAVVFKPEEYNVKIISVSNIPLINWKYGSLCDYSYWVREGNPEDMEEELLRGLENNKITPVSHTNIGGFKVRWNEMWLRFFGNNDIDWLSLDDFATTDMVLPMWRIPRNKNAPYTPEKRPLIPYDEEEDINNPCRIEDLPESLEGSVKPEISENKIIMFHNGEGPMCLEAMDFLETVDYLSEQVFNTEKDFYERLNTFKSQFSVSEGVSDSFGYYPVIFVKNRAFSGFNKEIEEEILEEIGK